MRKLHVHKRIRTERSKLIATVIWKRFSDGGYTASQNYKMEGRIERKVQHRIGFYSYCGTNFLGSFRTLERAKHSIASHLRSTTPDERAEYEMMKEHGELLEQERLAEEFGRPAREGYHLVVHFMNGRAAEEKNGTPYHCSVSSETYWSS